MSLFSLRTFAVGLALTASGCSQQKYLTDAGTKEAQSDQAREVPTSAEFSIEQALALEFPEIDRSDINVIAADLNGDGKPEWLVGLSAPQNCGTGGCTLLVFQVGAQDWVQIGRMPAVNAPYGVLPTHTDGWNDLFVTFSGGGGPSGLYLVRRIGGQYGPSKLPPNAAPIEKPDELYRAKVAD